MKAVTQPPGAFAQWMIGTCWIPGAMVVQNIWYYQTYRGNFEGEWAGLGLVFLVLPTLFASGVLSLLCLVGVFWESRANRRPTVLLVATLVASLPCFAWFVLAFSAWWISPFG